MLAGKAWGGLTMILRSKWLRALALAWLCWGGAALAQTDAELPVPFEAYGEDDPAAVAPKRVDPTDNRSRKMFEQVLQYDPENVTARIQNAELLISRGVRQRGLDEYAYALRLAGTDEKKLRTVYWNYGWALFAGGEARGAISQWMQAERLHGGRPEWVPTTYAMGLWAAGEKDLALQFYRAAVRSFPRRWGVAAGVQEATRGWTPKQKLTIEQVYAAWRENVGAGR
jgi:tetratricopeptide (TPR) repeat protein